MLSLIALCVLASSIAAFSKNRNVIGWAIAGLLIPVISVVAVCGLPAVSPEGKEAS
jgi:hypothetical protein